MRSVFMKQKNVVRMTESGFTLVELMIVVAIIGILSAIAIPNFQKYQAKARQKEAQISLSGLYTAMVSNKGEHGSYTACLDNAGFVPDGTRRYYTVGFANAVAAGATCAGQGNPAAACDDLLTVGIGAAVGTECAAAGTAAIGSVAVAFGNPLNTSASAYAATLRAGTSTGALELDAGLADATAPSVATVIGTNAFIAKAVGSISSGVLVDTWTLNQAKAMNNPVSGI